MSDKQQPGKEIETTPVESQTPAESKTSIFQTEQPDVIPNQDDYIKKVLASLTTFDPKKSAQRTRDWFKERGYDPKKIAGGVLDTSIENIFIKLDRLIKLKIAQINELREEMGDEISATVLSSKTVSGEAEPSMEEESESILSLQSETNINLVKSWISSGEIKDMPLIEVIERLNPERAQALKNNPEVLKELEGHLEALHKIAEENPENFIQVLTGTPFEEALTLTNQAPRQDI